MEKLRRYAPVLISTLCRYKHLKQCIESLRENPVAKYTHIYISVDYPPSQKYFDGYDKVKAYVLNEINGFYKVTCFVQDKNLGIYGNERFLVNEAYKEYDRYIFTEDDNIFAPSVLEYLNNGLDIFEKDQDIIAICAHGKKSNMNGSHGLYKMQSFSAYGFAMWKHKETEYMEKMNREYFQSIIYGERFRKLFAQNILYIQTLLSILLKKEKIYIQEGDKIAAHDLPISIYMLCEEKYAIYPRCLLARNNGYDGSGSNCKERTVPHEVPIDKSPNFYFEGKKLEIEKIEKKEKWFYLFYRIWYLFEITIFRFELKIKTRRLK